MKKFIFIFEDGTETIKPFSSEKALKDFLSESGKGTNQILAYKESR